MPTKEWRELHFPGLSQGSSEQSLYPSRGAEGQSSHTRLFTCFGVAGGCTAIAALHEDNVVQHIEAQTRNPNNEDKQRFLGLLGVDEPLDSLHEDAEHERGGEDRVAESPQHVRAAEAKGAGFVPPDTAEPDSDQPDDHGDQVGENSEGIRGQGEGVAHVGDGELDGENGEAQHAHEDEAAAAAWVAAHPCGSLPLAPGIHGHNAQQEQLPAHDPALQLSVLLTCGSHFYRKQ